VLNLFGDEGSITNLSRELSSAVLLKRKRKQGEIQFASAYQPSLPDKSQLDFLMRILKKFNKNERHFSQMNRQE